MGLVFYWGENSVGEKEKILVTNIFPKNVLQNILLKVIWYMAKTMDKFEKKKKKNAL